LLSKLRPFDIKLTKKITEVDDRCLDKISDKDIILFFGGTGSGKSATILYLSGCEMERVQVPV
jgi:ABC-type uncharacterized transport system ATPase subunit